MNEEAHWTLREMTEADLDRIADLEIRCFSVPWSRDMLEEELENERAVYLVAQKSSVLYAYAGMWIIFDEGHITNIAVDPDMRKQGLGKYVLQGLLEVARKMGVKKATLEVRKGNIAAISLYERFGFRTEGIRKGYYSDNGEDALILWVDL